MRAPKNLDKYISAEEAARGLEELAANLRRNKVFRPQVSWSLRIAYWNPAWLEKDYDNPEGVIVTNVSFSTGKKK